MHNNSRVGASGVLLDDTLTKRPQQNQISEEHLSAAAAVRETDRLHCSGPEEEGAEEERGKHNHTHAQLL